MITLTIERLQNASVGSNHMGSRYARLLQLLWRKPPQKKVDPSTTSSSKAPTQAMNSGVNDAQNQSSNSNSNNSLHLAQQYDPGAMNNGLINGGGGGNGFSWLDLGAAWNFATTQNQGGSDGHGSAGEGEGEGMGEGGQGLSPFDMSLLTDYSLLESDNPNFIF